MFDYAIHYDPDNHNYVLFINGNTHRFESYFDAEQHAESIICNTDDLNHLCGICGKALNDYGLCEQPWHGGDLATKATDEPTYPTPEPVEDCPTCGGEGVCPDCDPLPTPCRVCQGAHLIQRCPSIRQLLLAA